MERKFTLDEQAELAFIYEITTQLEACSDKELKGLALDEMDKKQPALQNLARFLYMENKFTMDQMMEITRLLILIWLYYKDKLKQPPIKIADPLYVEMRTKHEALMGKISSKNRLKNKQTLEDHLKEFPGRLLYGRLHAIVFVETTNKLATLSKANKAYLLSHFKIMMDCFETLRDRSIVSGHLN